MKKRLLPLRVVVLTFAVVAASAQYADAQVRTWTSPDGRYTVQAELVEVVDGSVRLRKSDGQETTVALEELSEADHRFVASTGRMPGPTADEGKTPGSAPPPQLGKPPRDQLVLRVVFFTPSDVDPPPDAKQRMNEIVDYTQAFFAKWMKHWGYESEVVLPVARDEEGYPQILFVKGQHTAASGRYAKLGFQPEAKQAAAKRYRIPIEGQVWWIWSYKGPETGWGRGGGGLRGGTGVARFYTNPGAISVSAPLGGGLCRQIMLKGCIHEMGHALGLPHVGPRTGDRLGNTLMGPRNDVYTARTKIKEGRVYLSEACAAMLWKHPLFSGTTFARKVIPKVQLKDFNAQYDRTRKRIEVTGRLESDHPAHSVVVANHADDLPSIYWRKAFVGRIEEDGTFKVYVRELTPSGGVLKIAFCFNNGATKGAGDALGFDKTAIEKPYKFAAGNYVFAD